MQGDPTFGAYYPACRGVLGFYDRMADVPKGTRLSYLVTGWYSDPQDDPLVKFLAEFPLGNLTQEQQDKQFTELKAWAKEQAWNITAEKPQVNHFELSGQSYCGDDPCSAWAQEQTTRL